MQRHIPQYELFYGAKHVHVYIVDKYVQHGVVIYFAFHRLSLCKPDLLYCAFSLLMYSSWSIHIDTVAMGALKGSLKMTSSCTKDKFSFNSLWHFHMRWH